MRPGLTALASLASPVRAGLRSRARFRPLLVVLACLLCVPAAVLAGPAGRPDRPMLVATGLLAAAAVAAWRAGPHATARQREIGGVVLLAATAAGLVVLAARSTLPAPTWLGLVAATCVSMAAISRHTLRIGLQTAVVAGAGGVLLADRSGGLDLPGAVVTFGPLVLLVAITGLASALAGDLELARRRELATRRAAERRAALLEAVRQLSSAGQGEVVDVTVEELRRLGFAAVAVLLVDREGLVARKLDGVTVLEGAGEGLSGEALATDDTVIATDYARDPRGLPGYEIGAVVATPIRGDGRTLGVLTVGFTDTGAPPAGDVEVVEVLASHLGGALVTERMLANQAALLARLRDLDQLRTTFVGRVSVDLRKPSARVGELARELEARAGTLRPSERAELLAELTRRSADLSGALEALLDFSRVQAGHPEPNPRPVDVEELLAPLRLGSALAQTGPKVSPVVVDGTLVRRALELLANGDLAVGGELRVRQDGDEVVVDVPLRPADALRGGFARDLAEQLLVAAGVPSRRSADRIRLLLPRHHDEEVAR